MKLKRILVIAFLFFTFTYANSFAGTVEESCTTGVYKDYYPSSCDVCGYHDFRFYKSTQYGLWDYFINKNNQEYMVTTNSAYSYAKISNIGANINYSLGNYVGTNKAGLTANWLPKGNYNNAVIFLVNNVSWNQNISDRNTPVGLVEYNLRSFNITSNGSASVNMNYSYLYGKDVIGANNRTSLDHYWVSSSGVKTYNPTPIDHKECYVMLPAWCGDGAYDVGNEQCDYNDTGKTNWGPGGCDQQCRPITVVESACKSLSISPTSGAVPLTTAYTCTGVSPNAEDYKIDCGNGTTVTGPTGVCTYTSVGTYTAVCHVQGQTSTACNQGITGTNGTSSSGGSSSGGSSSGGSSSGGSSSGGSSGGSPSSSGGGGGSYCGDGMVQRPNSNGEMEECDIDASWCKECKIDNLTYPKDGFLELGPKGTYVIGDTMNPYTAYSITKPTIKNISGSDLYLGELCVTRLGSPVVLNGNDYCETIYADGILRKSGINATYEMNNKPVYTGTIKNLPTGTTYADNTLLTTLKRDGRLYNSPDTWFAAKMVVRVAKPTIGTTGGGTSYVDGTNLTNVNQVNPTTDNDKNFAGALVGEGGLSSHTSTVTDSNSVSNVGQEGKDYNQEVGGQGSNVTQSTIGNVYDTSGFNSYNGLANAFVVKDSNFIINSADSLAGLPTGPVTLVIENGNLIINSNIVYNDNIAFVVRGGDIRISKDVERITGTYIAIPVNNVGGNVVGINGNTTNVLTVYGSFYGNVNGLVTTRTYIKQNADNLLDIGTVVNFGSSVFRNPAPLTATFISEYLEATKIPK